MSERCDVAVVGSGFAGSILARVLARLGHRVVLIERGRHPRFALGESTTPLANLALERLARRYDLPDLHALAAYGRWLRAFPELRRGLKRGFTFYAQREGAPYANGPDNDARLLVAASPRDEVADSHWLRADVDAFLARRAAAEGVALWEETELDGVEIGSAGKALSGHGARLAGHRDGRRFALAARFVADASGPGGFLARHLPVASAARLLHTDSRLVGGHFAGVRDFAAVAVEQGAAMAAGPYPDDRAAVHHLFAGGWMYVLPFDHGVASAGFLLRNDVPSPLPPDLPPERQWRLLLDRFPAIAAQFADARPVRPLVAAPRVQHRLARAAGAGWALLPHAFAFLDPLFSTGIAWSLLGVERLARLCEEGGGVPSAAGLRRYARLLAAEAGHTDRLTRAAYLAAGDFARFVPVALLYFAAASSAELRQRLLPEEETGRPAAWEGFLGADDPRLVALVRGTLRRAAGPADLAAWLLPRLAPYDLVGLDDPSRHNLHPVDLAPLRERADRLGLTPAELASRLHRLRDLSDSHSSMYPRHP